MKLAIIGFGIVGKNMHKIFPEAIIVDVAGNYPRRLEEYVDVAFVCVPTPPGKNGECDTSIVETAIKENRADVFCVKSTVPPGTIDSLKIMTGGTRIVFSPEYWGETVDANCQDYPFVILGGERSACNVVAEAYKRKYPGRFRIKYTDDKTACLCKYMENCFLAAKVTFCQEFYRIASASGVDYDELRELFITDPRVNPSHTVVFRDQTYWESKCLDKDIPALVQYAQSVGAGALLMNFVDELNRIHKEKSDVLQRR